MASTFKIPTSSPLREFSCCAGEFDAFHADLRAKNGLAGVSGDLALPVPHFANLVIRESECLRTQQDPQLCRTFPALTEDCSLKQASPALEVRHFRWYLLPTSLDRGVARSDCFE